MTETEFKCQDCGKVCKTKGALKIHIKTHDDLHAFKDKVESENKIKENELNDKIKGLINNEEEIKKMISEKDEYINKLKEEIIFLKDKINTTEKKFSCIINDIKNISEFLIKN